MRRDGLCHAVRQRLERLPPPYDAHYGVTPLPPPETAVALGPVADLCRAAEDAMTRVDIYAAELHDPFVISRVLARREAVTSSSIEGTQSTLDEVLSLDVRRSGTFFRTRRQLGSRQNQTNWAS
ncbi:MAG: Fic/DOC family N-terminal domain-containing protein [Kiloniellales bacterium]